MLVKHGVNDDGIIDEVIDAFEKIIKATVFEPSQHLIDADNALFLQAILAITNSMPEILGGATEGYIDTGKNQGAGKRYKQGLSKYIIPEASEDELCKIDSIHYKQIRTPLNHYFVVSNIWLEKDGESRYVTSEEVYNSIVEDGIDIENREELLCSLRNHPYKFASVNVKDWHEKVSLGFERYICELRKGDKELRNNFMKYVTQMEDWEVLKVNPDDDGE